MKFHNILLICFLGILLSGNVLASLDDGLIAYYSLNGHANDESGNDFDGIIFGAIPTTDRFGNINGALEFDGIDDYIEIVPSGLEPIQNFTISVWIQHKGWKDQPKNLPWHYDRQYIFDGHSTSKTAPDNDIFRDGFNVIFERDSYNLIETIHNSIFKSDNYFTETNIELNITEEWSHIVFVRDGENLYTYFNGELLSNQFVPGHEPSNGPIGLPLDMNHNWYIGTFAGNNKNYIPIQKGFNYSFKGKIDDLRIYNRALSDSEIQELYHGSDNRYNEGFQAGKQYCIDNPSACGLCACGGISGGGECASFNMFTNTLHIPCLEMGRSYWLDLELINSEPVQLELKGFGEN